MDFNLENFLKDLESLVNIESGSRNIEGLERIADFFDPKFKELGFDVKRIPLETGPCLRMKSNTSEINNILMVGHMDTVFKKGIIKEWPFSIDREEKKIYGPGVLDMKSGLLLIYEVVKNLGREFLDKYQICIIMNPDEEISSIKSKKYIIQEAERSNNAFIFEPSRVDGSMVKERKGIGKYLLEFKGKAAHSGVDPENGRSAINALARTICEIEKLVDYDKGRSINFGLISGGTAANVVAEYAKTELDLRYISDEQMNELEAALENEVRKHSEAGVKMIYTKIGERPPMNPTEKSLKLIELFNGVAESENTKLNWVKTGGCSDGNLTAFYGATTIDAIGPIGGGAHSRGEYLEYDTVENRLIIITKLIKMMAEKGMM